MKYYSPVSDYVKKSTFPDPDDVTAIRSYFDSYFAFIEYFPTQAAIDGLNTAQYMRHLDFPTAGDITALEGSGIDFVPASTFYSFLTCPFIPGAGATFNRGGVNISAPGQFSYASIWMPNSIYDLNTIRLLFEATTNPCNVDVYIYAGTIGEAYNHHNYSGTVSFNSPTGADTFYQVDIYSLIGGSINESDNITVLCVYTSSAPATNVTLYGLKIGFRLL